MYYELFYIYRGQSKQDEALECYGRAANLFKMAKKWAQAGNTFITVAQHHAKLGNKHDAATNYVDAANCFKKADPKEAVNCLDKAVDIYTDMGRFTIAAKHHQTIAEIFESDIADLDKAMTHFEKAADYFKVTTIYTHSKFLQWFNTPLKD
jgi:alpha-soluble NSF attachment protein